MKLAYFAGKVKKSGWRDQLLGAGSMSRGNFPIPQLGASYGGPFALACDHGCYHQKGSHGLIKKGACQTFDSELAYPAGAAQQCLRQIRHSSLVVAYIEDLTAYGTFAEIGYASANEVPVIMWAAPELASKRVDELWFIKYMPWVFFLGYGFPQLELIGGVVEWKTQAG